MLPLNLGASLSPSLSAYGVDYDELPRLDRVL